MLKVDNHLRELERQAINDHQAALKLANELKRLISDNWSVIPCPAINPGRAHLKITCRYCKGKAFVRVNVTELEEFPPPPTPPKPPSKLTETGYIVCSMHNENLPCLLCELDQEYQDDMDIPF